MEKLLLTVREAREILDISRSCLYALIRTGQIDSIKVGATRRVPTTATYKYGQRRMDEDNVARVQSREEVRETAASSNAKA